MSCAWGIHFPGPRSPFISTGVVVLTRAGVRDLRLIGNDRARVKEELERSYPGEIGKAVPIWAGVLLRFAFEPEPGDALVHPQKAMGTVSLGMIDSNYLWEPPDRHCRRVVWRVTGLRRGAFSETAQREFASRPAFFALAKSTTEVLATLENHATGG